MSKENYMARYLIEENELISLLRDKLTLEALENGGVDNWQWYGESLHEHEDWNEEECEFDVSKYLEKYKKA
jgi:hypothetical protein